MILTDPRFALLRQLTAFGILLLIWEAAGRYELINPLFVPSPSKIGARSMSCSRTAASGRISKPPSPPRWSGSRSASSSGSCSASSPRWSRWSRSCSSR